MENNSVIVSAVEVLLPGAGDWSAVVAATRDTMPITPWPESVDAPFSGSTISKITTIDQNKYLTAGQSKVLSRFVIMSVNCAGDALKAAGYLDETDRDVLDDIGCIVGTSRPELGASGKFMEPVLTKRYQKINPLQFPLISRSAAVGQICIRFQLRGYCPTISLSRISGAHAVARSMEIIQIGRAKRMLVGGVETLSMESLKHNKTFYSEYFGDSSLLRKENLVPSEGACFLVLQDQSVKQVSAPLAILGAWQYGRLVNKNIYDSFPERLLNDVKELLAKEAIAWSDIGLISTSLLMSETNEEKLLIGVISALNEEFNYCPAISNPIYIVGDSEACANTLIIANAVQYVAGNGYIGQADSSVANSKNWALAFIVDGEGNYYLQLVKSANTGI
jgi:hypothetical protein